MTKIKSLKGRQVFDSRGNPTVEAEIFLENNISATAISPSGASTGAFEAHELRDKNKDKFLGKSVNIAVDNINKKISNKLIGLECDDQNNIDNILIDLDTPEQLEEAFWKLKTGSQYIRHNELKSYSVTKEVMVDYKEFINLAQSLKNSQNMSLKVIYIFVWLIKEQMYLKA